MRKKLDTRIPASRIKKIMQADEDVGKIALPVPLLVSKALELFLQTLCKETCKITIERGAKTISAAHLKQCVQRFDDFDFLREIVNKVPDMRSSDASGEGRNGNRKRKALEEDGSEEEFKRARTGNGRGHRRGRGRGRGARGGKSTGKTSVAPENFEDEDLDLSPESSSDEQAETLERCADVTVEARGHRRGRGRGRGRGARGGKSSGKTSVAPENFEDEDLDLSPESSSDEQAETLERCADVTVKARGHRRGRGRGRGRGARGGKSSGKTSVAPENFEDEDLDLSPESSSDEQAETLERCADVTVEAREPTEKVVLGSTAPFVRDFDLNLDLDDDGNVVSSQPNVKHLDAEVSQPIVIHLNAEVSQSDLKQEELYPNWSHSNGYDLDIDRLHFQMHLDRTIDQDEDDYDNDEG